jgi:serine/threonine-protein kinase
VDAPAWQRLSALLDDALDLPDQARDAWLAALHAREPTLAPQVERLLAAALAHGGAAGDEPGAAAVDAGPSITAPSVTTPSGSRPPGLTPPPAGAQAPAAGFGRHLARALAAEPAAGWPAPEPGQRLGPWQLLHLLGEGGMGQVWLAARADGLYQARAAIKLLRHDLTGPGLAARFARERALLARLTHPGIARLLDAGQDSPQQGGRAYLVIEHVPGEDLASHARSQRLPVAARVRLLLDICRAVEHAHAQLVVHRDLKPGNVIVTPEGQAKLLDFGIAALLDDDGGLADTQLTRQAGRRLTPAYAAPEQIMGAPIGVAADVYSLGVMLYELLSGVLPFEHRAGDSRTALEHAVLHTEAPRLTRTAPPQAEADGGLRGPGRPPDFDSARGDLEAIAAKAMRKRPGERYGSVAALAEDLERWLTYRPVSVRQEDRWHRARLWLRRHAALSAATLAVTLSLSGGLAAALWQRERAQEAARTSDQVTAYLGQLLASANPDNHQGRAPTVIDLLERSRAELPQRFQDDPATRARLLEVLVTTYRDLNRYDIAIPLAEQLMALRTQLHGESDLLTLEARMNLARIYTSQNSPVKVIALTEPLHAAWVGRHGEVSLPHANLLYLQAVAYARVGRFADSQATLDRARPIVDALYRRDEFEHLFFENYVYVLRMAEGRFREAEAVLRATQPRWADADPRYARFVLVLRRNLLSAQIRQGRIDGVQAEAEGLMAEMDTLLGPGNAMSASLRSELARWHAALGRHERAAELWDRAHAEMEAAGVEHAAERLPMEAERLLAHALAHAPGAEPGHATGPASARAPAPVLPSDLQQATQALQASAAVSGPARVSAAQALARAALLVQQPSLAGQALAIARADSVLHSHPGLASRTDQIESQLLRAQGRAAAAVPLLRQRIAWLSAQPEPDALAAWATQLDLALALAAAGEVAMRGTSGADMPAANAASAAAASTHTSSTPAAAAEALERADQLRPAGWPSGHPFDGLRQELAARLTRGQALRPGLGAGQL